MGKVFTRLGPHALPWPARSFGDKTEAVEVDTTPQSLVETRYGEGELKIIRWLWRTDVNGKLNHYLEEPINGTLQRFVAYHSDSSVAGTNYALYLYDPFEAGEADDLLGKCASLTYNSTDENELVKALGTPSSGVRPMRVMGNHRLSIICDYAESTYGVFELHYIERFDLGHDVAGLL